MCVYVPTSAGRCIAAFVLNFVFWFMVNILYFQHTWSVAMGYFRAQVLEIWPVCVSGFHKECTDWQGNLVGVQV